MSKLGKFSTLIAGLATAVGLALATAPAGAQTAVSATPAWLIGYWVLGGDSCESDGGVRYGADGRWEAFGARGTWRIEGDRLITLTTERWEDYGDPVQKLNPPERVVATLSAAGPNRARVAYADGSVVVLNRCPAES